MKWTEFKDGVKSFKDGTITVMKSPVQSVKDYAASGPDQRDNVAAAIGAAVGFTIGSIGLTGGGVILASIAAGFVGGRASK